MSISVSAGKGAELGPYSGSGIGSESVLLLNVDSDHTGGVYQYQYGCGSVIQYQWGEKQEEEQ